MLVLLLLAVPVGAGLLAAGVEWLIGISGRNRNKNPPTCRDRGLCVDGCTHSVLTGEEDPCRRVSVR